MSEPVHPDVPPQRFEQRGNWKHLITDEQEWLARPARWGIEKLPEPARARKQALFNHHYYSRTAELIECGVCRPLVQQVFAEERLHIPDVLPRHQGDYRVCLTQLSDWYSAHHPVGRCDAWGMMRVVRQFLCGIVTETELLNKLVDELVELACRVDRSNRNLHLQQAQAAWERTLALELVGPNPFRSVALDPAWRTFTATALAQTMYESRDFSTMPILADALQDEGCEHASILNHCRDASQPHFRGCWVVDLVLGKN